MTNLKSPTPTFFLQAILVVMISVAPSSQSRYIELPNKANLIERTCKETPYYDVCIQSLRQYPESSGADVSELGLIMVKVMRTKANEAINKIHELQNVITDEGPQQQEALDSCAKMYNIILVADIPEATKALQIGDPKYAEKGANDAANVATYCESDFSGKSPLTRQNNAMHDVAAVTAAIVRLLL